MALAAVKVRGRLGATISTEGEDEAMNQMEVLVLVWDERANTWVYDDPAHGRVREPFVLGVPRMIDRLLVFDVPQRQTAAGLERRPFRLLFSREAFPEGHRVEWVREEAGGNWYRYEGDEGWLCPALLDFFERAPAELWVKAEEPHA